MAITAPGPNWSFRWLALPAAIIVFATGVWVAGGVVTDSFRASMALVALWYVVAAAATAVIARRRRRLALPLIAGYLLGAAGIAGMLAAGTLRDRVVDERVVVGPPASQVADARRPVAVTQLTGHLFGGEHATRGTASVVRTAYGRRVLTLTGFATSAG